MVVADAQREVRVTFLGGFISQLVSGIFWLASAAFVRLLQSLREPAQSLRVPFRPSANRLVREPRRFDTRN